jgi:hypothetical protein
VLPLIILPLFGIAFAYPFGGGISSDGTVNYRSTETLNFNEYWYEFEDVEAGSTIDYTIDASPGPIDFIIWDDVFDDIPITWVDTAPTIRNLAIESNEFEYEWAFLKPGSTIHYNFTADDSIEFFIADTENIIKWNNYESAILYEHQASTTGAMGDFDVNSAGDYYVVWYNEAGPTVNVDIDIWYENVELIDFEEIDNELGSNAYANNTSYVDGSFTVPTTGKWYFFVFFNPFISPEETMDITFDVTFELGDQASVKAWIGARPWLVFFGMVAVVFIIAAVFNRRKQKEFKTTKSDAPKSQSQSQTVVVQQQAATTSKCPRCDSPMKASDIYCNTCGEKREGRRLGMNNTTEREGHCDYCGAILSGSAKFCTSCGSRIK